MIGYLNGKFVSNKEIKEEILSIEDKSKIVYEVILFSNNRLIDFDLHIERLNESLESLGINKFFSKKEIEQIIKELIHKNEIKDEDYKVYVKVAKNLEVIKLSKIQNVNYRKADFGYKVITIKEEQKATKRRIKTIEKPASKISKTKLAEMGVEDAILVDTDGTVTEGCYSNVFIVDKDDIIKTHIADDSILDGITRRRVIKLAIENGMKVREENFLVQDLFDAKEVFITGSANLIRGVVEVDGQKISNGKVGKIAKKLIKSYGEFLSKRR